MDVDISIGLTNVLWEALLDVHFQFFNQDLV